MRKSGMGTARWARWGGALLGALVLACGPVPEAPAPGAESRGPETEEVEEVMLPDVPAGLLDADGVVAAWKRSGVSSAFDVSRPALRIQPTGRRGPAVASDGDDLYLVTWLDERTGGVFASRVKSNGDILDPAGFPLNLGTGLDAGEPRVAWDGNQFVVVWVSSDGIFGAHVKTNGDVRRQFIIGFSDEAGGPPGIACTKKLCLVAYSIAGDEEDVIIAARIDDRGRLLKRQSLSPAENTALDPAVAWDGKQFLVVWSDDRGGDSTPDIYGGRVKKDGTLLDPGGVPIIAAPGAQTVPDLAWTGVRFLAVWQDDRNGTEDIYGARVRSDTVPVEPLGFGIATGMGDQTAPRLAPSGSKSLVVWDDTATLVHRIRGARVADSGIVLDPSGFAISSGDFPDELLPAVAAGDQKFFVAFAGQPSDSSFSPPRHILGTRVKHDTTVRDSPALLFTRSAYAQEQAAAAYGDGRYLVVWRETRSTVPRLLAARVRADGRVLDVPLSLPAPASAREPAVAFDGTNFLVVWEELDAGFRTDVRGARVSSAGVLLDPTGIDILVDPGDDQRSPMVASAGGGFLVVWEDTRSSGAFGDVTDIFGARVSSAGTVLDPGGFVIAASTAASETLPAVVATSGRYFVVWINFEFTTPTTVSSVLGARVETDGTVLDSPGIFIGDDAALNAAPGITSDGSTVLVTWAGGPFVPATSIFAARLNAAGTVLDVPDIVVAAGGDIPRSRPTATFDGTDFWLVWEEPGASIPENERVDLKGARIRTDGTVRDPGGRTVADHDEPEYDPILVSDGAGRSAVFYTEFITEEDVMNTRIQGRVLTGLGPSATAVEAPREEAAR